MRSANLAILRQRTLKSLRDCIDSSTDFCAKSQASVPRRRQDKDAKILIFAIHHFQEHFDRLHFSLRESTGASLQGL